VVTAATQSTTVIALRNSWVACMSSPRDSSLPVRGV
jgi:hypothetical protein